VRNQRQRLIDEENAWRDAERAEAADPDAESDAEANAQALLAGPPPEAIAKFKDYGTYKIYCANILALTLISART
jgi:hypothetical protein